jgi:molybdenum-dependent DNA-binding transcriptional regulator ModE
MQMSDRIGRRMKLHDLHVLMAVVQAGSMSAAAKLLNTTQPAVSRSIADLEHAVGVRLLDRSRQGAEPTEYGRALLDGGVAMFDDLRQAVKNIELLADPTVGDVRVGAHDPVIMGLLPAALDRLHRKHRGVSVDVVQVPASARSSWPSWPGSHGSCRCATASSARSSPTRFPHAAWRFLPRGQRLDRLRSSARCCRGETI